MTGGAKCDSRKSQGNTLKVKPGLVIKPAFLPVAFAPEQRVLSFSHFFSLEIARARAKWALPVPKLFISAASLAIRRDVPLTERIKRALPVRKQGTNKGCYFHSRKCDYDMSPIAGVPSDGWKLSDWRIFPKELFCNVVAIASQRMPREHVPAQPGEVCTKPDKSNDWILLVRNSCDGRSRAPARHLSESRN